MSHCLLLGLVTLVYLGFIIALGALWMATMQCDLAVLVILQVAFTPHTPSSYCNLQLTGRPAKNTASERRPRACLPEWTSICMCLPATFRQAAMYILRAFHSADIGITTETISNVSSAGVALVAGQPCLRTVSRQQTLQALQIGVLLGTCI